MLMAGMAERRADDEWAGRIAAIEDGMYCRIDGRADRIPMGMTTNAPMQTRNAVEMRAEYIELVQNTRAIKQELNLPPGIEAAEIIDMRGTYDAMAAGGPTQLRDTTAAERADSGAAQQRMQTGAAIAIGGAAAGVVGNYMLNVHNDGRAGSGQPPPQVQQRPGQARR